MARRIITAAILLAIVYLGFAFHPFSYVLIALLALIGVSCTFELATMLRARGLHVYRRIASVGVVVLMLEAWLFDMTYSALVFGMAVSFAWTVRLRGQVHGAWADVSATCFTMAYIGIPLAAIVAIFTADIDAKAWLLLFLFVIWTTDSVALFAGRAFGRTKLWPKISPGKTWEGSGAGTVGALVMVFLARLFFPQYFAQYHALELVIFGLLMSLVGQFGDLAESLLKRDIGVKDSGSPITGHGGCLDLMDAVLFAAIPFLVYLHLLHPELNILR